MSKRYLVAGCLLIQFFACVYSWCFVLDTSAHRTRVAKEIQSLVLEATSNPLETIATDELLHRSRSDYSFEATCATAALGDLGDAAGDRIENIASLMESPNPYVRREAARALSKLGPRSLPALPMLKQKVENDVPADDETWFAALAIGEMGEPAISCLPLLRSRLGTGSPQYDVALKEAIQSLENTVADEDQSEASDGD